MSTTPTQEVRSYALLVPLSMTPCANCRAESVNPRFIAAYSTTRSASHTVFEWESRENCVLNEPNLSPIGHGSGNLQVSAPFVITSDPIKLPLRHGMTIMMLRRVTESNPYIVFYLDPNHDFGVPDSKRVTTILRLDVYTGRS